MESKYSSKKENSHKYATEIVQFGDIKPGDYLLDENDEPVEVKTVTERHLPSRMFEVGDGQGNTIKVSGNHMWYIVTDNDRETHVHRIEETKQAISPLIKGKHNSIVKNRLISFAENFYKKDFPVEIPVLDMTALLFDKNDIDVKDPKVAQVFYCVQRIADSVGIVSEQKTTLQDLAYVDESEDFKENFYDARLLSQQILAIAGERKWKKKYPIRVGKVVTTIDMLELMDNGHNVYIPD